MSDNSERRWQVNVQLEGQLSLSLAAPYRRLASVASILDIYLHIGHE